LKIQTKFSPFKAGKDKDLYPYDVSSQIEDQVKESIESSCRNLQTEYVDCLLLHSLYPDINDTIRAWRAMEALVPSRVRMLGLSNTDLSTLRIIYDMANVKPSIVQNRLTEDTASKPNPSHPSDLPYPIVSYDRDVRSFCAEKNMRYSPWGVLWGNARLMEEVSSHGRLMEEIGITPEVACLASVQSSSVCVSILSGSKKVSRMHEVVQGMRKIENFCDRSEAGRDDWLKLTNSVAILLNGSSI